MSDESENTLLKRAAQGDETAFASLVEQYAGRLYSVCFSFLGQRQDAEDCVQEAFIKAYRAIGRFNFRSSFYTWIYRIAVNTCHDYRRKRKNKVLQSLEQEFSTQDSQVTMQIASEDPQPDEVAERDELRQTIRQEIDQLPDPLRQILILRDLESLSYQEIADILDLNMGTVKSRLARARRQLMQRLRQREQAEAPLRLKTERSSDRRKGGRRHEHEL